MLCCVFLLAMIGAVRGLWLVVRPAKHRPETWFAPPARRGDPGA